MVTNNDDDFRELAAEPGTHPGLVVLPQRIRSEQATMLTAVLEYIEHESAAARLSAAAWMTNKVIEYHDEDDTITAHDWPPTG